MMKLRCLCCGIESEFSDSEEAFEKGWDAQPHFSCGPLCDLCPASLYIMGISHEVAHQRWVAKGRPEQFSVSSCGAREELK